MNMDPREIRAIRGPLSQAAFARLIGVTRLTVLRWELPDDNKEARRPRPHLVAALRKVAAHAAGIATEGFGAEETGDGKTSASIEAAMTMGNLIAAAAAEPTSDSLLGDVVRADFNKANLAMVADASGSEEVEKLYREVTEDAKQLGTWSPQPVRRVLVASQAISTDGWHEETMTERLAGAIDRLSGRGASPDDFRRGLALLLGELFPGREAIVGAHELPETSAEIVQVPDVVDGTLSFGVRGKVSAEERAALRILAAFVPQLLGRPVQFEPEALDQLLPHFIAAAPATRKLKSEILRLSNSCATILIGGESGTGKEVVARALHDLSARADKPYIVFNCASVPRDLFESQLFGYRKGAFTGASNDSVGVIRAADAGTLFLDEVGELPLETQPKLLRFLENAEVTPLGEQKPRRVDVRVLAATHRDLVRLVRDGRFREDLYYRLNVIPLHVPALRERREDILALAHMFIRRLAADTTPPPDLAPDAVHALHSHSWPGNVRELRNVIERAMAYSPVPEFLHSEDLRIPVV